MRALLNSRASVPNRKIGISVLFLCSLFLPACSVPNLETTECIEARPAMREFYSFHFGNDQKFAPEDLELRGKYLTPEFAERLRSSPPATDPFTLTANTPKGFRMAECRTVEPGQKASFDLQLFWRTDERSEQRTVKAEAVKHNDKWLVNAVTAN